MIKRILLLLGVIQFGISLFGQDDLFRPIRYGNSTSSLRFSVEIPQSWKEVTDYDDTGYLLSFIETDSAGTPVKKLCLDTVRYRLKYFSSTIPVAMEELGFRNRGNGIFQFELNDYIHVVVGFEMKDNNYTGLNCSFIANLQCEVKKSKKKNAEMQYLFFSNGTETICLINNGIPLTESALTKIERTFKFD